MESLSNQFAQSMNGYFSGSVFEMVTHSGPVAKAVLLILLLFSIVSWAIIFQKIRLFRKARKETDKFMKIFRKRGSLNNAYASSKLLRNSHLATIFIAGYLDIASLQKYHQESKSSLLEMDQPMKHEYQEELKRAISKTASQEISRFEKSLSFLATTGSTAPFIGLFGTVWGIMDAFRAIGLKGSTSIGGVAPGISEALIATAAGLAAAIPAVIAYNHFNSKTKVIISEMDEFSLEFLSLVERIFLKKR